MPDLTEEEEAMKRHWMDRYWEGRFRERGISFDAETGMYTVPDYFEHPWEPPIPPVQLRYRVPLVP